MPIKKILKNPTPLIDLSKKNIKGVLDLKNIDNPLYLSDRELLKSLKFNNIKKLDKKYYYEIEIDEIDCSNNEITEIINIPSSLKYLNCSNNQITSLLNLPYTC
jgi:Leucine-rich repeat (LRR) protein